MSLNLITGRPNSGKTEALYAVAAAAARTSVPTILLPSAPDVTRARRELCVDRGLVTVRVEQIDRYLSGLWEIHGDGRRLVTPTQRTALMREAISQSGLQSLTASASTRGFATLMERLSGFMVAPPKRSGSGVARGIIDALNAYHDSLVAHELVEPSEANSILADRAAAIPFDGPLCANRFDDLTVPQERLLMAAAAAGADVWLAVTGGDASPAVEATHELIERLRSSSTSEIVADVRSGGSEELASVAAELFAPGGRTACLGDVSLSVAYGEEAEAERVTAEVVAAHRSGIGFGQIAVIYRDTRRHYSALRRAFSDAAIPADYDVRFRFGETGFGRAILTLLDFAASGRRTQLVAFLGSGFSGLESQHVDQLDAMWRRQGLSEGMEALLRGLERANEDTRRSVRLAVRLARSGVNTANVQEWKDMAGTLLARGYGREGSVLASDGLVDAAAHKRFCDAVDDLSELGALGCDPIELREILIGSQVALPARERADHVQVMDVERVRGRTFACVIIAGLVADEFPRKPREGLFSGSRLAEELQVAGVVLPKDGGIPEERLLFYLAVTRASQRLILSRQAADSDGRPLRPSTLLEELLEMYRDSEGDGASTPVTRTLAFADLGVHSAAPDLVRRALRTVAMSDQGGDIAVLARANSRADGTRAEITAPDVLARLEQQVSFTVTELETYLRCPYSWFYGRFVRPEPLEEGGDAMMRGSLVHAALHELYRDMPAELGLGRVSEETLDACLEYAAGKTDAVLLRELGDARLRDRIMAEEVKRMVSALIVRDAAFLRDHTPTHFEWSFGRGDDPPAEFEGFALRGQIDRVDIHDRQFVVIDYKSGHASPAARFELDGVLQAPLYAEVVRRRLGGACAGSFYRGLSPKKRTEQCRGVFDQELVTDAEFTSTDAKQPISEVIDSALVRAAAAAAGIRAGNIQREPLTPAACRYCKARAWCEEALG